MTVNVNVDVDIDDFVCGLSRNEIMAVLGSLMECLNGMP